LTDEEIEQLDWDELVGDAIEDEQRDPIHMWLRKKHPDLTESQTRIYQDLLRRNWDDAGNGGASAIAEALDKNLVQIEKIIASMASFTEHMCGVFAEFADKDKVAQEIGAQMAFLGIAAKHVREHMEQHMATGAVMGQILTDDHPMAQQLRRVLGMANEDDDDEDDESPPGFFFGFGGGSL
jgi:hypothetical protein